MSKKIYDYLVIGGGSGGIASARRAAMFNKKVAVFESKKLGGTCVNVGCVPKKLLFHMAGIKESIQTMAKFKSEWFNNNQSLSLANVDINFAAFKRDRDLFIKRLNGIYQRNLDNSGVDHIHGHAKFLDNNTLECDGTIYQADHICIATGSQPIILDIPGKEHVITSDGFFELEKIPKRTLIIGGGYIGNIKISPIISTKIHNKYPNLFNFSN